MRRIADSRAFAVALSLLSLAVAGLLHARYGTWRPGPGGGPTLVPALAYLTMIPATVVMAAEAARRPAAAAAERPALVALAAAVAWALVYFWLARTVGLVAATVPALVLGMTALSPAPWRSLRVIAPVCLALGGAFWLLFTQIAPVLQTRVLLF